MIRLATNKDCKEVIELIDEVFREYGDRISLDGAEADLLNLERNYFQNDGAFWVYVSDGDIIGTVAVVKENHNRAVLKRVYLKKTYRGSGIADKLLTTVYEWCKNKEIRKLYFWSDTRFDRGHQFYQRHGFKKGGTRSKNDGYMPYQEYYFEKNI